MKLAFIFRLGVPHVSPPVSANLSIHFLTLLISSTHKILVAISLHA